MKRSCKQSQSWKDAQEKTRAHQRRRLENHINEYNENPTKCLTCTDPLPYGKRKYTFCSRKCANVYNNHKRINWNICLNCGKKTRRPKYCSKKCSTLHQLEFRYEEYISRWKEGKETGRYGKKHQLSNHIRRYVFRKFGSKCCKCGWSEKHPLDNRIPLEINHIDGNATNNKEDNLELLCPNCHSLTLNYKSRNRGKSTRNYI